MLLQCLLGETAVRRAAVLAQPEIGPDSNVLRTLPKLWRKWLPRCLTANQADRCTASQLALLDIDLPTPVAFQSVQRERDTYRLHWHLPPRGTVRVYRWRQGRCPAQGEAWLLAELERVATAEHASAPTEAIVRLEPGTTCHIIVATVIDEAAVIGESIHLTWAADVERLHLAHDGRDLIAMFDWPEDAGAAWVVAKEDGFPTGPDDPAARAERCFRAGYLHDHQFVLPLTEPSGTVYVAVYAIYRHDDGWEQASGRTSGARAKLQWSTHVQLRYRIKRTLWLARFFLDAAPYQLILESSHTGLLPGLALVANKNGAPTDGNGDLRVLDIPSERYQRGVPVKQALRFREGVTPASIRLLPQDECCNWLQLVPERA